MNLGKISFIILTAALFFPFSAKAATLYLDPVSIKVGMKDVFEVQVKVGLEAGECINAARIGLIFPPEVLSAKDFNSGESIFSLWVEKPSASDMSGISQSGKIFFSGGLPGGYCGQIPGDPGESNVLGSVIFNAVSPVLFHKAGVDFDAETEVYLNDGQGTKAKIETQGLKIEVDENQTAKKDDWEMKILEDKTPPEPFVIEISRDPKVAEGRSFIVFSTTDKQTGVDHYEVLEAKPKNVLASLNKLSWLDKLKKIWGGQITSAAFEKANSPYILKDQALRSVIKVKAVDRAGNERLVEYQNDALDSVTHQQDHSPIWPWASGMAAAFAILLIALTAIFKLRK